MNAVKDILRSAVALLLAATMAPLNGLAQSGAQDQGQPKKDQSGGFTMKVTSDLVLVNVVVRDKQGNLVRGLKGSDFTLLEDGKPQKLSSFDFEDVEQIAAGPDQGTVSGSVGAAKILGTQAVGREDLRNRRLIVLFFDFSNMETDQVDRAVDAAVKFVDTKMSPADSIAVVTLSTGMQIAQDFTSDKTQLKRVLQSFGSNSGQGFDSAGNGDSTSGAETGASFTPDDSDYAQFNSDRKLQAITAIVSALAKFEQKKSLILFSNGVSRSGIENQATLRAATNAAVKANVSIYPLDVRGLEAFAGGGSATQASLRGTAQYTGQATLDQFNSNADSQETLSTLAEDTGGRAFFDSNDFTGVFARVQRDTSAYYVLGYHSNNPLKDGKYRRVKVALAANNKDYKLENRAGYYAPKDFGHFNSEDKEQQMQDELASDLPDTDVSLYIAAAYFRVDDQRYYVPVSLVVPGSQIPFTAGSDKDKATIDVIGVVRDEFKRPIGSARETVKLNIDQSQQVRRKNVQYNTGFMLPPGKYHMKFVVRENQSGRLGSFETDIVVPDLRKEKDKLKLSAVVLSNQRVPAGKKSENPLVHDGAELVPNITHVFSPDQHLYMQFEVYDPAKDKRPAVVPAAATTGDKSAKAEKPKGGTVRVLSSISFFQGKTKAFETPLVEEREINAPQRKAAMFQLDVPLAQLKPGLYTCQVNVIDDAAGSFAFPRLTILVRPPQNAPAGTQQAVGSSGGQ